ncbi:MAG: LysR family transcriptional regulator [Lawsonibacter sp.]|nr:LysR family transcriptional regulator [Lawsonibacter sp.]
MNTNMLRYMVEFAAHSSSQKAAEYLGVSRSSISRNLKKLEDELGTQLFVMTPEGAVPTYAGDICLQYAQRILRAEDDLRFDLLNADIRRGIVNIGMEVTRSARVLPYALPLFQNRYPGVKVNLLEMRTSELESALISQRLDFAVICMPFYSQSLSFEPLMTEPFVLVAPKDDPFASELCHVQNGRDTVPLEQFRGKPFVMGHPGQKSRIICDQIFQRAGFEPNVTFCTRNNLNAAMLAYYGLGYALVPLSYTTVGCEEHIRSFYLDAALDARWVMGIATLSREPLSHAANQLRLDIRRAFRPDED